MKKHARTAHLHMQIGSWTLSFHVCDNSGLGRKGNLMIIIILDGREAEPVFLRLQTLLQRQERGGDY